MSSSVWVQLYYEGKEKPERNPIEIRPIPADIADLAKAVKVERKVALSHCDAADLLVFSKGTKPPVSQQDKPLNSWDQVPSTNSCSGEHPLIVVAPAPPQQLQLQLQASVRRFSGFFFVLLLLIYSIYSPQTSKKRFRGKFSKNVLVAHKYYYVNH